MSSLFAKVMINSKRFSNSHYSAIIRRDVFVYMEKTCTNLLLLTGTDNDMGSMILTAPWTHILSTLVMPLFYSYAVWHLLVETLRRGSVVLAFGCWSQGLGVEFHPWQPQFRRIRNTETALFHAALRHVKNPRRYKLYLIFNYSVPDTPCLGCGLWTPHNVPATSQWRLMGIVFITGSRMADDPKVLLVKS